MHSWLLWTAVGSTATLSAYGWPALLSTFSGALFCLCWIVLNVSTRALVLNILGGCCDVFFRQIIVVGAHKLNESKAPLLLAIAPHANQFIDPIIVLKTFGRPIGFLCASKSMRYKRSLADIVAFFARVLEAVPVERPQDLARVGLGRISAAKRGDDDDDAVVRGVGGTKFTEQATVGGQIVIAAGPHKGTIAKVAAVVGDELLRTSGRFRDQNDQEVDLSSSSPDGATGEEEESSPPTYSYKLIPKLDHHEMYDAVYDRLTSRGAVGIFPEGGSHDRASLLPLKAGIAVMALGACERHGEDLRRDLRIVAVGLNYFSGHRFRSRVFVDYGEPFEVKKEFVEMYKAGDKRAAGAALLDEILTAVKAVTVQAPDHKTQELLYMLRRLFVTEDHKLTIDRKVAITRGIARAFEADKHLPQVQDLVKRVSRYNEKLKQYNLHDRRVALGGANEAVIDTIDAVAILGMRCTLLLAYVLALLPGLLLASPLLVTGEVLARSKARAAVAGSRVKLEGKDVVGTWKVLVGIVFVPVLHFTYTALIYSFFAYKHAVAYFFFMPFVSATSIIASESAIDLARSIGALYLLIFDRHTGSQLRSHRQRLKTDLKKVGDELGWTEIITKSASRARFTLDDLENNENDSDSSSVGVRTYAADRGDAAETAKKMDEKTAQKKLSLSSSSAARKRATTTTKEEPTKEEEPSSSQ
mmetsp:Transcript_14897/g.48607  ORF Transcript_14897/g.48607 Transcript_14897/m.48607 type:complete len:699 (+) Transcript_14897:83-2179(+)